MRFRRLLPPLRLGRVLACFLALSAGTACAAAEPRVLKDVEYGRAGGEPLLLDACVPEGEGPFPVVIVVHGGGWTGGDKRGATKPNDGADITPLFAPLTGHHLLWFSINYRLAPQHRWPAGYEDVLTAIRWAKANAATYGGNAKHIALLGHSAGAQLICLAAVQQTPATAVQAVVGLAAPTDLVADCKRRGGISPSLQALLAAPGVPEPELWRILHEISPLNHVRAGLPPFLLLHGTDDKSVPYAQSVTFQAALQAQGNRCELVTLKGAPHRLTLWSAADAGWAEQMAAWLETTLSSRR